MDIKSLTFGDSIAGLLIDGAEDTPYVGATLKIESDRGVVLEVPYIDHPYAKQFEHVAEWFKTQDPPVNLILQTIDGELGLFGNSWKGHRNSATQSLGTVRPSELLIGEYNGDLFAPLLVEKVRSRIDGLATWISLRSIEVERTFNDQGLTDELLIKAKPNKSSSWTQGEATMQFISEWQSSQPDRILSTGLSIDDGVVLLSEFPEPRPFSEHLEEQKKVLQLLTLVFGSPIHFREHKVRSSTIVEKSLAGTVLNTPYTLLVSSSTVHDYGQPRPKKEAFNWALTHFDQLGVQGLESWAQKYDKWGSKFIYPAVAILAREKVFAEEAITTLSMTIEAAGSLLEIQPGEECTYKQGRKPGPSTSTYFYRCLVATGTHWGDIAPSYEALARGLARTYNATKHFNAGKYPEPEVLMMVSKILRYLVRLLALYLADETGKLLDQFRSEPLLRLASWHKHFAVSFDDSGNAVPYDQADESAS